VHTSNLYWPALWNAALHTLEFTVYSVLGSLLLGLVLALMKVSRSWVARMIAIVYTEIFRNSPLLVVIFVIYFGLPAIGIVMSTLVAGCLSMSLFFASYLSEIFRAGLEGVPQGQREAGYAAGLSTVAIYRHIVLPQALRLSLAATGNMIVDILKSTSLLATITGSELLTTAQTITSATFKPMQTYLLVGAIYFVMCFPLSRLVVSYETALKAGKHFSLRRRRIQRHIDRMNLTSRGGASRAKVAGA
jgi:polar amino acid transport system permease protein